MRYHKIKSGDFFNDCGAYVLPKAMGDTSGNIELFKLLIIMINHGSIK